MVEILTGTQTVKIGHAQMLKGGVIMDVVNREQAVIAEEAGAVAVMALERVPADIRADGGVARMTDPAIICAIMDAVSIPVMAKCRIGHFVEAQVLEALGVDYVDTEAGALAYLDRFGISYPNGPDLGTRVSQAYRTRGVPETFIVGPDGRIAAVQIGPYTSLDQIVAHIEQAKGQ